MKVKGEGIKGSLFRLHRFQIQGDPLLVRLVIDDLLLFFPYLAVLSDHFHICLISKASGIGMGIHHKGADIHGISLKLAQGKGSRFQGRKGIIALRIFVGLGADHVNVVLGPDHSRKIGLACTGLSLVIHGGPPVRHHDSFKSPFSPQNYRIQLIVSGCPDSVYRPVAGHNGVCPAFLHGNLIAL